MTIDEHPCVLSRTASNITAPSATAQSPNKLCCKFGEEQRTLFDCERSAVHTRRHVYRARQMAPTEDCIDPVLNIYSVI